MGRSRSPVGTGPSVAAAAVLLVACGGSGDEDPTGARAPATTAGPADPEFCTAAASIQERLQATVTGQSDPTRLPAILDEAATEIRAVEAPAEIAPDWSALASGVEQFSAAIAGIDFTAPDAVVVLEQTLAPLEQQLGTAASHVGDYLRDECGIS